METGELTQRRGGDRARWLSDLLCLVSVASARLYLFCQASLTEMLTEASFNSHISEVLWGSHSLDFDVLDWLSCWLVRINVYSHYFCSMSHLHTSIRHNTGKSECFVGTVDGIFGMIWKILSSLVRLLYETLCVPQRGDYRFIIRLSVGHQYQFRSYWRDSPQTTR